MGAKEERKKNFLCILRFSFEQRVCILHYVMKGNFERERICADLEILSQLKFSFDLICHRRMNLLILCKIYWLCNLGSATSNIYLE